MNLDNITTWVIATALCCSVFYAVLAFLTMSLPVPGFWFRMGCVFLGLSVAGIMIDKKDNEP